MSNWYDDEWDDEWEDEAEYYDNPNHLDASDYGFDDF